MNTCHLTGTFAFWSFTSPSFCISYIFELDRPQESILGRCPSEKERRSTGILLSRECQDVNSMRSLAYHWPKRYNTPADGIAEVALYTHCDSERFDCTRKRFSLQDCRIPIYMSRQVFILHKTCDIHNFYQSWIHCQIDTQLEHITVHCWSYWPFRVISMFTKCTLEWIWEALGMRIYM